MNLEENSNEEFINPIDKDNITETPNTLAYPHHRGGVPIIPTKKEISNTKSQYERADQHPAITN